MPLSANAFSADYTDAYGIKCAALETPLSRKGVYPTFCQIAPGKASTLHAHFEEEVFYIIHGTGRMTIAGQEFSARTGDLIRIPPHSKHTLHNESAETLTYLSVYSEDLPVAAIPRRALITAAPPTPNGPVHLGHMSGPYLAADIITRYLKLRGSEARSYTGTDDHQNYVAITADKKKQTALAFRDDMRRRITQGFERVDIQFDHVYAPMTDEGYQRQVQNYFATAVKRGVIVKESLTLPYCTTCDHGLCDGLIIGTCPYCHAGSSGTCESCGIVVSPDILLTASCTLCHLPAAKRLTEVFTFDLGRGLDQLIPELMDCYDLSPHVLAMIESVAGTKEHKVIVAYPNEHKPTHEITYLNHRIHVWFEMAAHFSTLPQPGQTWIHTFGFDNSFHYLLFIPSLWRALDPLARLPDTVIINEFLNLEGQKFSTSRNHAIWIDESRGNSDHLRLYLVTHRPQDAEDNFAIREFEAFSTQLDRQMMRLFELARASAGTKDNIAHTKQLQKALHAANRFTRDIEHHLAFATLDLRQAAHRLLQFIDAVASRSSCFDQADKLLIRALIIALKPFMPREALRLANELPPETNPSLWVTDWTSKL